MKMSVNMYLRFFDVSEDADGERRGICADLKVPKDYIGRDYVVMAYIVTAGLQNVEDVFESVVFVSLI